MYKSSLLFLALSITGTFSSLNARAEDSASDSAPTWAFSPAVGISTGGALTWGMAISRQTRVLGQVLSVGPAMLSTGLGTIEGRNASGTFFLVEARKPLNLPGSGFYFGASTGVALMTYSDPGVLFDRALHFALGATSGYEFALGHEVGIAPEAYFLLHTSALTRPALGAITRVTFRF